jgi:uncharacterized protein YecT (DUF1311 family)
MEPTRRCPYCAEEILAAAIKCKHCQSVLGIYATNEPSVSPHPESVSTRPGDRAPPEPHVMIRRPFKIMLQIVIAIIGAAWLFSVLHPNDKSESELTTAAREPAPNSDAPQHNARSVYATTAVELFRSYQANEVATDQKIGSAMIEITGTVKAIDKNMFGEPEIRLEVGDDFSSVTLTLDKSQLSVASGLTMGQSVVAHCDKVTRIIDYPVGEHCQVISRPQRASSNLQSPVSSQSGLTEPRTIVSRVPREYVPSALIGDGNVLGANSASPAAAGEPSSGTQPSGVQAGFDCTKAQSPSERLICADPELSALDRELSVLYKQAMIATSDKAALVSTSRSEWRRRENVCASKDCLIEWYEQRREALKLVVSEAQLPASNFAATINSAK